jgi:hypothetical protein
MEEQASAIDVDGDIYPGDEGAEAAILKSSARMQKRIEAVIGRSLDDNPKLTEDEIRMVKDAGLVKGASDAAG